MVKSRLVELGEKEIWANTDLPTYIRAPGKYLFGLKKSVVAWGFARGSIRVEVGGQSKHLKVEGKVVLSVTCVDGCVVCDWEETWGIWEDLHGSTELKTLTDACNKMLLGGGKGKGKEGGQ